MTSMFSDVFVYVDVNGVIIMLNMETLSDEDV